GITLSRIVFSILLLFIMDKINSLKLLGIIALFLLTDQLDGFLARKFKVQSLFGAVADTLADKILCLTLLIPIFKEEEVASLLIIGELGIALVNGFASIKGKLTKASLIGKAKMWILSINIVLGILAIGNHIPVCIFNWVTMITFLVQAKVLVDYIQTIRKEKPMKRKKITNWKDAKEVLFSTDYYLDYYKKVI
ncbi:MAG: CDP-alcohol phosphatidyltransferase family protein, partial [Bacilli bacterium]|nr:CDP-alcohol phosphatidyltransferase family protein [Bacilli bacterium]